MSLHRVTPTERVVHTDDESECWSELTIPATGKCYNHDRPVRVESTTEKALEV